MVKDEHIFTGQTSAWSSVDPTFSQQQRIQYESQLSMLYCGEFAGSAPVYFCCVHSIFFPYIASYSAC